MEDGGCRIAILYTLSSIIIGSCLALVEDKACEFSPNPKSLQDVQPSGGHRSAESRHWRKRILYSAGLQRLRQDYDLALDRWLGKTRRRRNPFGRQLPCIS